MRFLGLLALCAAMYLNVPQSTLAQPQPIIHPVDRVADEVIRLLCYRTGAYVKWLQDRLGEQILGYGITNKRSLLLTVSKFGSWSIIGVDASGRTCILAGGTGWTWTFSGDP